MTNIPRYSTTQLPPPSNSTSKIIEKSAPVVQRQSSTTGDTFTGRDHSSGTFPQTDQYFEELSGTPASDLAKSYFEQASLEGEIDGISAYISAQAEIEKAVLSYNSSNPDSQVKSFEELLSKKEGGSEYLKALIEKTGLSPEELLEASKIDKSEMVLRASKINEQISWQYQIQSTKTQLISSWLKSLQEDSELSKSPS